jgi:type I restriction enzyme S subunit
MDDHTKEWLLDDLLIDTRDGEWGEGAETPGHELCEVIRGTDFASLRSPDCELPKRWIADRFVARKRLQAGDIVIETAGGTATQSTGRTAFISREFLEAHSAHPVLCSSFARHLRFDSERVVPEYAYHLLQALYQGGYMAVFNLQHTGVARFQFTSFKNKAKLALPDRGVQRKIAGLLSTYDDLIANNQRRIALLETMAEEIYREWFVRMRFPGYGQRTFGLPNGWKLAPSTQLIEVLGGGTPSTDVPVYWGGETPFFTPRDAGTSSYAIQTDLHLTDKGLENCSSSLFPAGTIFITARGTVGKIVMAGTPMAMNQSCYALHPREDDAPYFTFLALRVAVEQIRGVSKSGVFDNIVMDTFRVVQLIDPGREPRAAFNEIVKPMFENVLNLMQANRRLQIMRDALLPRLISGKLRVDHLDIRFPPSMQDAA